MKEQELFPSRYGLETIGFEHQGRAFWNLSPASLMEQALARGEGRLSVNGALVTRTGERTGRSPNDKFLVREPATEANIHWGKVNRAIEASSFDALRDRMYSFLAHQDVFVQDMYAGAHPAHRFKIRVITELAWHSLFAKQLLIRPGVGATADFEPDFTIVCAPNYRAVPRHDGVNSEAFVLLSFEKKMVLIGGTGYAGEIKKSVFTVLNYLLPFRDVLPMHCSANISDERDVTLFFGLSGTGKTTLSADPDRRLIGDDEHGWGADGVFNFEGGCYAKVIGLSTQDEPQIFDAIRFGAVLENVVIAPYTHTICFDDDSITENTRAAYPLHHISNACEPSIGGHPNNIIFLTCDAFGVLPPISRLTRDQAMYHFLSGYTAKLAGTEAGLGSEPQATFSSCFGAPFLPLRPSIYAKLLGSKIDAHNVKVWLVNTGWSGGPFGVGSRIKLRNTRAMIRAALTGALDAVNYETHPVFDLEMPRACPNVPQNLLTPRNTWDNGDKYDAKARELADLFEKNYAQIEEMPDYATDAAPSAV